jgi:hypothetical protein
MVRVANAFPLLCGVSPALPALLGWAIGGDLRAAFTAFVWAGLVRVMVLQHVTWSVNSLCHMIGSRPYAGRRFGTTGITPPRPAPGTASARTSSTCPRTLSGSSNGSAGPPPSTGRSPTTLPFEDQMGWESYLPWRCPPAPVSFD